jgi:hypothetical protein
MTLMTQTSPMVKRGFGFHCNLHSDEENIARTGQAEETSRIAEGDLEWAGCSGRVMK